jgi:hypothetical protein
MKILGILYYIERLISIDINIRMCVLLIYLFRHRLVSTII